MSEIANAPGTAWFGGLLADGLREVSTDPADLERGGWWAVVATFEGELSMWRFDRVRRAPMPSARAFVTDAQPPSPLKRRPGWPGIAAGEWTTSLDRVGYLAGVEEIRSRIREGEVYQVNLCRVLSAPVRPDADPWALAALLARGNPAPYAAVIDVPGVPARHGQLGMPGVQVVSASPELFLSRDGDVVRSGPIKGTAPTAAELLPKDEPENIMIVDLVRNDLQRVCRAGTVEVPDLLALEQHPGLVHLVSTVQGRLRPEAGWPELLAATMPPGSVSGAPKSSALRAIADLEPVPRGPYCGAVGWVDADRVQACLAVGIRTFWWDSGRLCFGTGAGITWGSDAEQEWAETALKARRLVGLAGADGAAGAEFGIVTATSDGRVEAVHAGSGRCDLGQEG